MLNYIQLSYSNWHRKIVNNTESYIAFDGRTRQQAGPGPSIFAAYLQTTMTPMTGRAAHGSGVVITENAGEQQRCGQPTNGASRQRSPSGQSARSEPSPRDRPARTHLMGDGVDDRPDAELLASELVANAAEHGNGAPIGLTIREHPGRDGQRGVICQITDTAPGLPRLRQAQPDSERGRGLRIVAALATECGITTHAHGKTAWFTLTASPELELDARQADRGAEASA